MYARLIVLHQIAAMQCTHSLTHTLTGGTRCFVFWCKRTPNETRTKKPRVCARFAVTSTTDGAHPLAVAVKCWLVAIALAHAHTHTREQLAHALHMYNICENVLVCLLARKRYQRCTYPWVWVWPVSAIQLQSCSGAKCSFYSRSKPIVGNDAQLYAHQVVLRFVSSKRVGHPVGDDDRAQHCGARHLQQQPQRQSDRYGPRFICVHA